jgi:hypothetical protein
MIEGKSHIDDQFIPEGLEFREEYMHAALGNYRRKKRVILWRKVGFAGVIVIAALSSTIAWMNKSEKSAQAEEQTTNSHLERHIISNDSSSTNDLENDEGTFNKNRQSPAVESIEATQDLSTKAVDMGDPMSSGVGLPGQLSPYQSNLHAKGYASKQSNSQSNRVSESNEIESVKTNNNQFVSIHAQENQQTERNIAPLAMPYLSAGPLNTERQLAPHKPLPQLPIKRWGAFASMGAKLWADYGFGSGPAQVDPILGLGVNYKWHKKISFQLAGQFFTVSGLAAPYVSTQRQYGEGFSESTYRYHTDRFYHTGLSVGANYRLARAHSFGIFAESTLLVTADNRIETGTSSSYESGTTDEVKARGYVQGFRSTQHSIGVNYEYVLGKNKSLGASYRQGLTDVTINSFFGDEMNRNSMLSFYFKIKLTR